jgi:hypothetical protein
VLTWMQPACYLPRACLGTMWLCGSVRGQVHVAVSQVRPFASSAYTDETPILKCGWRMCSDACSLETSDMQSPLENPGMSGGVISCCSAVSKGDYSIELDLRC